jgi:hypothetical protein
MAGRKVKVSQRGGADDEAISTEDKDCFAALAKSNHIRLAHSPVTLSEAKGLNRQILRAAQNDSSGRLPRKVYEGAVVCFSNDRIAFSANLTMMDCKRFSLLSPKLNRP